MELDPSLDPYTKLSISFCDVNSGSCQSSPYKLRDLRKSCYNDVATFEVLKSYIYRVKDVTPK